MRRETRIETAPTISAGAEPVKRAQNGLVPALKRAQNRLAPPVKRAQNRLVPALAHTQYARLWRANLGSQVAFWMQSVAQGWLVLELTNSPFALGLLAFFQSIPMLFLSPLGGVMADRLDRRRILLAAQVLMASAGLAVAILVLIERIHIVHLVVTSLVLGSSFAINMPARNALVANLVPRRHLSNAIGLNSTTLNAARAIGPAAAGILIGVIGIAGAYFAQVGGYVWSTVNIWRITAPPTRRRRRTSTLTDMREGFAYVWHNKPMLALMLLALAPSLFGMPISMLLPAFVKLDLAEGPETLGVLLGSLGVGALIGSVVVVTFSGFPHKGKVLFTAILAYGLLLIGLSFTHSVLAAGAVLAFIGFFQALYMATNQMTVQLIVPDELRGRVVSLRMMTFGLSPLGLLPLSVVAQSVGTPVAMVLGGALTLAVALAVLAWARELWHLQPEEIGPEPPAPARAAAPGA